MRRPATARPFLFAAIAVSVCALSPTTMAQGPADVAPVPSGPAVALAEMQAKCDPGAVGRTTGARRNEAFKPNVAGAAAVLSRIAPIFDGFAPNGFETRTGGTVFTRESGMPAFMHPWNVRVLAYPYSCLSSGKFFRDDHYGFSAYFEINNGLDRGAYTLPPAFNPNSSSGDGTSEDSRFGFYRLHREWLAGGLPQARDGYFHIADEYQDTYWFTRGGQLPFDYVTREEFLRKQIGIVQTALAHERGEVERNYAASGQKFDDAMAESMFGPIYQKPLARYQQLLTQPAAWLQQQAIVHINPSGPDYGYEFLDASQVSPDVLVPVKPNPGYLDGSKPAGAPQYLVIRLGNQAKRGEYYQLRELIERNVETLKALVN